MRARVVFLTVMPSPYQRELFKAMHADRRLDIRVLYCTKNASDRDWDPCSLFPFEEILPGTTLDWLGASAHLNAGIAQLVLKEHADLFILGDYSAPTTQIAMRLLTFKKKKWVFWGELPGLNQRGRLLSGLRKELQRPISRGAAAVAAIGSAAVDAYQNLCPGLPVYNIPYFCSLEPFKTAARDRRLRRKATVNILFSGQLIARKGVDLLIEAFLEVAHLVPDLHLTLLGTGPGRDALSALIPAGLCDRVHFLGFQQPEAIPEIFAAADVFVLPSRHDGWGVVVNEALGAGLPIVVSDRVGARDLVEEGRNGFVAPAGDVESLANALLALGQSDELRTSFGSWSAQQAEHWDVGEGVRRWVDLCGEVLAG